jgi:hypothetical protein
VSDIPVIVQLVAPFVGGTAVAGLASYAIARRKAPAEVDSIIVTGAQNAVIALEAVVRAETARADRAEARLLAMEAKFDAVQGLLDEARAELHAYRTTPA